MYVEHNIWYEFDKKKLKERNGQSNFERGADCQQYVKC